MPTQTPLPKPWRLPEAMTTAVIFLEEDAQRFIADRPAGVGRILALTPAARLMLREAGIEQVISGTLDSYGKTGHRRVLVRLRRADRGLAEAMSGERGLSVAAKHQLSDSVWTIGAVALRLFETLGREGPWLIADGADWRFIDDKKEAVGILYRKIMNASPRPSLKAQTKMPEPLIELAWRMALWRLRRRRCVVIGTMSRGLVTLAAKIHERDSSLAVFSFKFARDINVKSLLSLIRDAGAIRSPMVLSMPNKKMPAVPPAVLRLLAGIQDPLVHLYAEANKDLIISAVQTAEVWSARFDALMRIVGPEGVVVYDAASFKSCSLVDAARRADIPSLGISNSPNVPADTGTIAYYQERTERRLLGCGLVGATLVQTPLSEKVAERLCPGTRRRRSQPVAWGHKARRLTSAPTETRHILYAGNYIDWPVHIPWMYETSDELVASLSDLINVVATAADVSLTVRAKRNWQRKRECTINTLEAFLPSAPNVRIKDDGLFEDDLLGASLVVSFSSTTIYDALLARRPVLLWGHQGRYCHMPARYTPPTANDRAAVYAPRNVTELAIMIPAVLDAHAGRLLTVEETAPYVWSDDVPGMDELADGLAAGDWGNAAIG